MTETSQTGDGAAPRRGGGPLGRVVLFLRQVVDELSKVVRPTREELLAYTSVVLVFVAAIMVFVSALDVGLGRLVLWVFGGGPLVPQGWRDWLSVAPFLALLVLGLIGAAMAVLRRGPRVRG